MPRIHASFTEEQFDFIKREAEEMGMPPSTYVAYIACLGMSNENSKSLQTLKGEMFKTLSTKESGEKFVVSTLFPIEDWSTLDKETKKKLALILSAYCKSHQDKYKIQKYRNVNQYTVI